MTAGSLFVFWFNVASAEMIMNFGDDMSFRRRIENA